MPHPLYKTAEWQALRMQVFVRDRYTCQRCGVILTSGRTNPRAAVADHICPHKGDARLFYDPANVQALCKKCHDTAKRSDERRGYRLETGADGWPTDPKHPANGGRLPKQFGYSIPHGVERSGIPVILVCGAPASGKSTYVRQRAMPGDVIVDFDEIRKKVGGRKWDIRDGVKRKAFAYRDRMICGLKEKSRGTCWLIVGAPTAAERAAWKEALGNVSIVIMQTPKDECIARIRASDERAPTAANQIEAVEQWFAANPS